MTASDLKHVDFTSDEQLENGTHILLSNSLTSTASGGVVAAALPQQQAAGLVASNVVGPTPVPPPKPPLGDTTTTTTTTGGPAEQNLPATNQNKSATGIISKEQALLDSIQRSLAVFMTCSKPGADFMPPPADGLLLDQQNSATKEYWVQRLESKYFICLFFCFPFVSVFFPFFYIAKLVYFVLEKLTFRSPIFSLSQNFQLKCVFRALFA